MDGIDFVKRRRQGNIFSSWRDIWFFDNKLNALTTKGWVCIESNFHCDFTYRNYTFCFNERMNCVSFWRIRAQNCVQRKNQWLKSLIHHKRGQIRKGWMQWKSTVREQKEKTLKMYRLRLIQKRRNGVKCLRAWNGFAQSKQYLDSFMNSILQKRNQQILVPSIKHWNRRTIKRKVTKRRIYEAQKKAMDHWKHQMESLKILEIQLDRIAEALEKTFLRDCFAHWQRFTKRHILKKQQKAKSVLFRSRSERDCFRALLKEKDLKRRRILRCWIEYHVNHKIEKHQWSLAMVFSNNTLQQRCLRNWKRYQMQRKFRQQQYSETMRLWKWIMATSSTCLWRCSKYFILKKLRL